MAGLLDAFTRPAMRIGARYVEIAQYRDIVEAMRRRCVAQHVLGHQLGPAVGIDRLGDCISSWIGCALRARHRRPRWKKTPFASTPAAITASIRVRLPTGVVAVIFQRVCDRFADFDAAGEMHHRIDLAWLGEDIADQRPRCRYRASMKVMSCRHGPAPPGRQIVERDDAIWPASDKREDGMAADKPGGAGDKNSAHRRDYHPFVFG